MKMIRLSVTFSVFLLCLGVSFVTHFIECQVVTNSPSRALTTQSSTTTTAQFDPNEVATTSRPDDISSSRTTTTESAEDTANESDALTTERSDLETANISDDKDAHLTTDDAAKEEKRDEPEEKSEEPTEGETEGSGAPEKNENETSIEEEEPEDSSFEERCTFNQFLSGLNISHYLPEDRGSLREEYEAFQDIPERIRYSPSANYTIQRLKRLLNLANGITSRQELRSGFASFIQHNYDLFLELELDASCLTSIISIIASIRRSELWAIKFVDSMAKPPPGLLSGVTSFLGDFDQCLSVKSPETANEEFTGQYCLLRPILPLPDIHKYSSDKDEHLIGETKMLNYLASYNLDNYVQTNPVLKFIEHMKTRNGRVMNLALCLPSLCSPASLEKSFNRMFYPIVGIPFEIPNSSCWTLAKTKDMSIYMNGFTQMAIFVFSFVAATVILSTLYELYTQHFQSHQGKGGATARSFQAVHSWVYVFSAISNTRRLLSPATSRIAAFDTLRLVIIVLIGLTNSFINTPLSSGLRKLSQSVPYEMLSDPKYFFIRAPTLLNDGLLVIAGALLVRSVFSFLNACESSADNFGYILYLFRRWLRLTTPLFGSMCLLLLLPLTGYGPLWDRMIDILLPPCRSASSLTSSLLFYSNWNFLKSNFSNGDAYVVCNPDTWFLSILFQLNVAFFMIVIFVRQSPRNGLRLLVFFTFASLLFNVSPKMFHSTTHTFYELTRQPSLWHLRRNYFLYHQNILQYIGSFSVGTLLGYAIMVHQSEKNHQAEPSRKTCIYNWTAVGTIVVIYVWVNQFFMQNESPSELSALFFFSFGRLAFSLAFAWIIYSCVSNKSPTFATLLSAPTIQPIARLSFCIFLVQNLVQHHRMYSITDTYVMTFRGTIENYTMDFVISTFLGYCLYLLFEGPSQRLNELFSGTRVSLQVNHLESNLAYMLDGQMKAGDTASKGEPVFRKGLQPQHLEKGTSNHLTHRSKVIEAQNVRTVGTVPDEFTDGTIISIRF